MKTTLFILFALLFGGCSTKVVPTPVPQVELKELPQITNTVEYPYNPKSDNWITMSLFEEYKKWYQTPYKYGGVCLKGVDCSSLVQNVYKNAFNITLPRSTTGQVKAGYKVKRNATKEGDLVFFKTGHNTKHVGIVIEKGKFINATSSNGVKVSELNNPYWKEKYWQSRRVIPY